MSPLQGILVYLGMDYNHVKIRNFWKLRALLIRGSCNIPLSIFKNIFQTFLFSFALQLEKAQHLLFLVGLDDRDWNAPLYIDGAERRLRALGCNNYEIARYPKAGHLIEPPYSPVTLTSYYSLAGKLLYPREGTYMFEVYGFTLIIDHRDMDKQLTQYNWSYVCLTKDV